MAAVYKIPVGGVYPPLSGATPQWWSSPGGGTTHPYIDAFDMAEPDPEIRFHDPRWAGAFKKTFTDGTNGDVDFRALSFNQPNTINPSGSYLFLSWYVKAHPGTTYENSFVDLGIHPTSGPDIRCRITLANGLNGGTSAAGQGYGTGYSLTYIRGWTPPPAGSPAGTSGTWSAALGDTDPLVPAWVKKYTRVWTGANGGWWAVQMCITPENGSGGSGALDLSQIFGLGSYVEANTTSTVIDYHWPDGLLPDPFDADPRIFSLCYLKGGGSLGGNTEITSGVVLTNDNNHFGTNNIGFKLDNGSVPPRLIPDHRGINLYGQTTFFATPKNNDSVIDVPAGAITARFILANFGSTPPGGTWKTLGSSNSAVQQGGAPHPQINHGGNEQKIQYNWTPSLAETTYYKAHPHQCMMVDLSTTAPQIVFLNSSVADNFDFGKASRFAREAEISVVGLADRFTQPQRDVYIYVERRRVPSIVDGQTSELYQKVQDTYQRITRLDDDYRMEQRFVSIIQGDLRHLRYINFEDFIGWSRTNLEAGRIVVEGGLFDLLRPFGIVEKTFIAIVDRFADQARAYYKQLTYNEGNGQPNFDPTVARIVQLILDNTAYRGDITPALGQIPSFEELSTYMPIVCYHVYHDTGRRKQINGVTRPILEAQPSFGYFMWLDHDVDNWELRLQGAEKVAENFYVLRVPNNGTAKVTTVIQAIQKDTGETADPPEKIVPFPTYTNDNGGGQPIPQPGCLGIIITALEGFGPIGKVLAQIVRGLAK